MNNELKSKIYEMVNSIEDENVLQVIKEDIAYYDGGRDIIDELNERQLNELNEAISQADKKDSRLGRF